MNPRLKYLVELLLDRTALLKDRDAAAKDLFEFDSDFVLNALILVGCNKEESPLVSNSCGESLGSIWVRNNTFDKKIYNRLSKEAKQGVCYILDYSGLNLKLNSL